MYKISFKVNQYLLSQNFIKQNVKNSTQNELSKKYARINEKTIFTPK